jgi:hypothetical protein
VNSLYPHTGIPSQDNNRHHHSDNHKNKCQVTLFAMPGILFSLWAEDDNATMIVSDPANSDFQDKEKVPNGRIGVRTSKPCRMKWLVVF